MKKFQLVAFTLALGPIMAAHATDAFTVRVKSFNDSSITDANLRAQYEAEVNQFAAQLSSQVNDKLSQFPTDTDKFMDGTAKSMVQANAGTLFDYNTNFKLFLVGVNAGATFDKGDASLTKLVGGGDDAKNEVSKIRGAGASGGLMVGLPVGLVTDAKIGPIDLSRMNVYASLFFLDLPKMGAFDSNVKTFGVGAQYKLIPGISVLGGLAGWGGINVQAGLKYTKVDLSISHTIQAGEASYTGTVGGQNVTGSYVGDVSFGVDSSTFQIPIEVSTSAKLVYFLDFFFGVGTDIALGSSTSNSDAPGDIKLSGFGTAPAPTLGAEVGIGDGKGKPNPFNLRYFAGIGIDAYVLNLTVQFNQDVSGKPMGVNVGLKGYW